MKRLAPLLLTLLVGTVSACGGQSDSPAAQPTGPQPTAPSASPCPQVGGNGFRWPSEVPSDLPQPPGAKLVDISRTAEGLTIVKFSTATSLQQSVLFVVREVQKAGFTLGRGDAEPAEADAPFGRGDLRGIYKMLLRDACTTDWLVAVTRVAPVGTTPLLPTPSHGPSSQPLPFG
jgi:hypothetical protein